MATSVKEEIPQWIQNLSKKQQRQLRAYSVQLGNAPAAPTTKPTAWTKGPPIGSGTATRPAASNPASAQGKNWVCKACGHKANLARYLYCNRKECSLRWNFWDSSDDRPLHRPKPAAPDSAPPPTKAKNTEGPEAATGDHAEPPPPLGPKDVAYLETLAERLKTTQADTATLLLQQANHLRLQLPAQPEPPPKPPPPPEILLPRHLGKLRKLEAQVVRNEKALATAHEQLAAAQALVQAQTERLQAAKARVEAAQKTRQELLDQIPKPTTGGTATPRADGSESSSAISGLPGQSLVDFQDFLGRLLTAPESADPAHLAELASGLRHKLAAHFPSSTSASAAGQHLLATLPKGDSEMLSATEGSGPEGPASVRVARGKKQRTGSFLPPSAKAASSSGEGGEEGDNEEADTADGERPRSRSPKGTSKKPTKTKLPRGPGTPKTDSSE
jgi:hypothetical protein